jgi:acetylornithine deacetylase
MGRIIAELDRFDRQELRSRTHPLLGPASQHCALVQGGSGLSTYAEECTLKIERRTLPGETPEQALEELKKAVRSTGEEAQIRLLLDRPPLSCDADAEIVISLREAITYVTGQKPEVAGVGYWMDAALFAAAGIPTANHGPSGAGAHEAVEWVDLDSVVTCAQVLVKTAWNFCGR